MDSATNHIRDNIYLQLESRLLAEDKEHGPTESYAEELGRLHLAVHEMLKGC